MKIAELFVALGFKVEGGDKLQQVDRNLGQAAVKATSLLVAITAVNAAFYVMMNRAIDSAVGLDRWQRATGRQVETLQRMQYGAEKANTAASTISEAILNIQKTRAEISLGNAEASQPWFLLGLDPRQDPFVVLEKLRTALKGMDPALQRDITHKMGFGEDLLYMLQQNQTVGRVFISQEEIDKLTKLGGAWRTFLFTASTAMNRFAASFAPSLAKVLGYLERIGVAFNNFTTWLNGTSLAADTLRTALFFIVAALGVAAVLLTGVVGLLGALKAVLIAIQLIPIVAALGAIVAVIGLMIGALVGLVLLIQDFWTQIEGGKSLFDWNENLLLSVRNVERLAKAMEWVIETASKMGAAVKRHLSNDRGYGFGGLGEAIFGNPAGYRDSLARPRNIAGGGGSTTNTASVEINVNGAGDPVMVGRETGRTVGREISDAMGMAPLPTN